MKKNATSFEEILKEFNNELEKNLDETLEKLDESIHKPNPLVSSTDKKNKWKLQVKESFHQNERKKSVDRGCNLLKLNHIELMNASNVKQSLRLQEELTKLEKENPEIFLEKLVNGTLQEVLSIKEEKLEEVYNLAKNYHEKGHYQEAKDLFNIILFLNPFYGNVWVASALTSWLLQDVESCMTESTMAVVFSPQSVEPYFCMIDCHLTRGENSLALPIMHSLENLLEHHPAKETYWNRFLRLREII